ncbi:uncharacterized protein [Epargyreus clarus]|uniref:uncharacterized protein isoform X2 n=1 Tax=Epargyreus clarus TaxID=520877 RepID=UPI003C2F22DC
MENMVKVSQSASPAARAGAGDFSECARLSATPPARLQAIHPKKLFSTPVSKFTAKRGASGGQLARLRSCLDEYRRPPPAHTPTRPKALSMEDLTPNKRVKKDSEPTDKAESPPSVVQAAAGAARRRAAARVARFLLLAAWRRRREEVLCLRKTLDSKRSSTERLRIQVWVLKSLLDADNAKVVLAMRELERLKQLLRDKDLEKAVLEREKLALEKDVCAAEDRASELSIGWRNSRRRRGARAAGPRLRQAELAGGGAVCARGAADVCGGGAGGAAARGGRARPPAAGRGRAAALGAGGSGALRFGMLGGERPRLVGGGGGERAAGAAGAVRSGAAARPGAARLVATTTYQDVRGSSVLVPAPDVPFRGGHVVPDPLQAWLLKLPPSHRQLFFITL